MPRHILQFSSFILCLVGLALAGCSSYSRHAAKPPFHRIYVEPVDNRTVAPQVVALFSKNLREEFLRDGSLQLVDRDQAEVTLTVRLVSYDINTGAYSSRDTDQVSSLLLNLGATGNLIGKDGTIYFENRPFQRTNHAFTTTGPQDLPSARYQTLPSVAEQIARDVKNAVTGVW